VSFVSFVIFVLQTVEILVNLSDLGVLAAKRIRIALHRKAGEEREKGDGREQEHRVAHVSGHPGLIEV
jgi:hypothetical protein